MKSAPELDRLAAGDLKGLEARCAAVLEHAPRDAESLHLLGLVRLKKGRLDQAIELLEQAVEEEPAEAVYHESLADAYYRKGSLEPAAAECMLAMRLDRTLHHPLNLLGLIARDRCEYSEAIQHFSAALEAKKPNLDAMINLSTVLNRTGDYPMAADYSRLVLRLVPEHPLAWTNLGLSLKGMGRTAEAKEAFARVPDFPLARFNLGYTLLLEDDLANGLPLYEARKKLLGIGAKLRKPEWQGEPCPGKTVLVIHEQGFGDTILMSRFYPRLFESFAEVVVLVQEPLARLIATVDPRVRVVTGLKGVRYDTWCAHMSLPLLLGIDGVEKIPNRPWLSAPAPVGARSRLRVGLNWAGNPRFAYDFVRSTRLEKLRTFLQVRDVDWCSLHKGHLEHEAEAYGLEQPLKGCADFYDTALVLAGLDLVISTETAVPNLSAALGVRTCVLAGPDCDWRWKSWYPGVTICAQDAPGNWFGAIAKALEVIRQELLAPR